MALPPLQLAPPKPRMTLDEFRAASTSRTMDAARELRETMDAFQNAAARLGFGTSNLTEGSAYPFNRITLNYVLLTSLYRGSWIIRKIVDALVDDMTKNWLTPTSELTPAKLTRFRKEGIEGTGTIFAFKKGMKMGRLYGGAGAVIVVKGRDDFEKPLKVEDVELDTYRGLLVFDRWSGIAPGTEISDDLDEPLNFGLPKYYQITTETSRVLKVHHTRVLRFCGPDLPNWEWQANMRWGASVVEAMFEELKKRDNTSWNIASLIFRANILELNSPQLEQMMSGLSANAATAQRFYSAISAMNQLMSNQGLVVTGEKQTMGQHSYSFGGVAEIYTQFMLDICGATEYPMSRLFGRSSSGLSGTNEGDEHSYYELVKQRQTSEADPLLRQLLPIIAMSVWGQVPKDFDWIWNPVNTPPDKERVELAAASTTSVVEVYNTGAISQKTLLMELKEQSSVTGLWTNITDDDIEAADDETQSMGEQMEHEQEMAAAGGDEGGEGGEGGGGEAEGESATDLLLGKQKKPKPKETKDAADPDLIEIEDAAPWEERSHPRAGAGRTVGKSKGGQFVKGSGGGGVAKKGSGVHGSHQTNLKFPEKKKGLGTERRRKIEQGVKGKHPEMEGDKARVHLQAVEGMVRRAHPEWETEQVAKWMEERYLRHIKEKSEAESDHKEQNGGKEMGAGTINRELAKPEKKAKAISAYGHDRKMGSIASTVGLPRNKAARGALRKMLRKAGVYKEAGGWEPSGKVDVGFAAGLVGKIEILEKHLSSDKITTSKNLGGGVNVTRIVVFEDGSKGIFKPHSGEYPGARRGYITDGYMTERETCAWEICKIVGMEDMGTPCVDRTYNGERGAVMEFNKGAREAMRVPEGQRLDGAEDRRRMAVYDFVIGNTDRHAGNWMINGEGKIKLIDHGLAFPEKNGRYRNAALDDLRRKDAGGSVKEYAQPFLDNKAKLIAAVKKSGMPAGAAHAMQERIELLAKASNWDSLKARVI